MKGLKLPIKWETREVTANIFCAIDFATIKSVYLNINSRSHIVYKLFVINIR